MATGLKQMVEAALRGEATDLPPVEVSPEAVFALSQKMREWSGWTDSHLRIGVPSGSPFAECRHDTHTFTVNADRLVLNPNRVLLTITPFRLKQEAVLTGAMLHESGHARHSHWLPRTTEQSKVFAHGDGSPVTKQTVALAQLMEEPRIEGLMARDADRIGATGLGWTMRASAAHLVPTTALSLDPNQKVMDLITSWALRAGRQIALHHHLDGYNLRRWVQDFTTLLHGAIEDHLDVANPVTAPGDTRKIMDLLAGMIRCEDDRGPTMIDAARDILTLLFPETDPDDQPAPGGGCQQDQSEDSGEGDDESESQSGEGGEGDEEGEQGDGNTEPEDEGSGDEPGAGDSGDDEQSDDPESGDSDTEGDTDEPGDSDTEGDTDEPDDEPEGEEDGGASSSSTDEGEDQTEEESDQPGVDTDSDLAQALADMEAAAKSETEDETEGEVSPMGESGDGAGSGGEGGDGGWRTPTKDERGTQKNAERFLRGLIEPSEASTVSLSDSPAATVDGAALSAWKAGGSSSAPHFFRRTRRSIEPSPPVKIAILVDISMSMEELQEPSALLSWALASAALDLRNFAGRGQQIESCLIHWGSATAEVIQRNGQMLPGIREVPCMEGTSAMHRALDLVEEELPGFFDLTEKPVHRLLVHFTDWELANHCRNQVSPRIQKAFAAGVNMVTIAPRDYSERANRSDLPSILAECKVMRGTNTLMRYNRMFPEQVWETAAESLR